LSVSGLNNSGLSYPKSSGVGIPNSSSTGFTFNNDLLIVEIIKKKGFSQPPELCMDRQCLLLFYCHTWIWRARENEQQVISLNYSELLN
jgi:hypothetical protein